ncbi:uncharacterized protein N7479_005078 [Penicillium vulpinum]|uniref:uncharacterized protein n=1 Tax=Penicillium vulpinum TaxID=29845 RepID=UPI002548503A|nr:uncharacterized protein N7479_005078 [Penicillium vulpinum]KAJ5965202.1 hypothetical protein N7479_005078 [Penicillium vulpinum]
MDPPRFGYLRRSPPPTYYASKEDRMEALNKLARPAADVSRILDEAQVPNFLWGKMALCLVGEWMEQECCAKLHVKSAYLWWLPDFELGPPAADHPDLMLSNDPRLPPFAPKAF